MPDPYFSDGQVALHLGNCIEVLRQIPGASVDAVCTDPPYNLPGGFMGAAWDNVGAGRQFQTWCEAWAAECLRVLKPGGHLLAFGAPRTYHRLASGIEDAGFEIRESIHWIFGSGFPKGQDIAKAIDKHRDDRAEILRVTAWLDAARDSAGWTNRQIDELWGFWGMAGHWTTQGVAACVPTLEQWDRLRAELAFDDTEILPLVEKLNGRKGEIGEAWAGAQVVGEYAGDLRGLAGERFGARDRLIRAANSQQAEAWQGWNTQLKPAHEPIIVARKSTGFNTTVANVLEYGTGALNVGACRTAVHSSDIGRWPTNVVFSHSEQCADTCLPGCPVAELDAQSGVLSSGANPARRGSDKFRSAYGEFEGRRECTPARGADSGGASRYFPAFRYEGKAPASERPKLADGTQHATVKPLELMRWLVRLVCPPGGTILDPFAGSGTTLEAAVLEGFNAIGIEREQQYADLCVQRLSKPLQPSLFGT